MRATTRAIAISILLVLLLSGIAMAKVDEHGNLVLENDYISIFVNQNKSNQGRFAVDVTGGAPLREGDEGKPLIYGRPKPWTSYTTVRIDKTDYVFGGPTDKRAGKQGRYGKLIQAPQLKKDQIITKYQFGKVMVTQILSFVTSNTTGLPDTAQIKYRVTNQGEKEHKLGLRIMLDTMLGANDGAPFRIKEKAVTADQMYNQEEAPGFWQAFDSLNDPQVTAQGTIKGQNITTPDRIYLADWGSLADGVWDFDFNPGQKFLRKGEFELDSALALLWQPETLQPGETREYKTNYGLGGITIVPGLLSLGVTSPAKVIMDQPDKTVQIVSYIQNTAEIEVEDVEVALDLPAELELVSESRVKKLGDLQPADTAQIMWEVRPDQLQNQQLNYQVKIRAENTDDNQVTRDLEIVGPPKLDLELQQPDQLEVINNQLTTDSVTVYSKITNTGASAAYGVSTYLAFPPGLKLATGDKTEKEIGSLAPGESVTVPWEVEPLGLIGGKLNYSVGVDSENAANQMQNANFKIPQRQSTAQVEIVEEASQFQVGDYLTAKVRVSNISNFYQVQGDLSYNGQVLEPVYISRGSLFVQESELLSWNLPQIDQEAEMITGISGSLDTTVDLTKGTIATVYFKIKSTGQAKLQLNKFKIYDAQDNKLSVEVENNQLDIGGNQNEEKND
ncbi:cohesin domain-containing protein [Halanaerobaculum tunisiense]